MKTIEFTATSKSQQDFNATSRHLEKMLKIDAFSSVLNGQKDPVKPIAASKEDAKKLAEILKSQNQDEWEVKYEFTLQGYIYFFDNCEGFKTRKY